MIKICKKCKKERNEKEFYLSHGYVQKICKFCSLQKNKEWREKNYDKVLENNKIWKRENNPRKTKKRWGVITYTKEQRRRDWQKYSRTSKGIYSSLKSNCIKKKNGRLLISQNDFMEWYDREKKECCWYKRLTIDRIDNNKGYELGNIALCCQFCNSIKNNFFSHNEMIIIGRIIKNKLKNKII